MHDVFTRFDQLDTRLNRWLVTHSIVLLRVAALLLPLAQEPCSRLFGTGRPEVRYTHEQLADMVGTYRETVTKILNEFRLQGWVELRRGKIILLDRDALAGVHAS